jgi:hypothetical protein
MLSHGYSILVGYIDFTHARRIIFVIHITCYGFKPLIRNEPETLLCIAPYKAIGTTITTFRNTFGKVEKSWCVSACLEHLATKVIDRSLQGH